MIAFAAPSGRITARVGPSGRGKTTSMRMINCLIEPSRARSNSTASTRSAAENVVPLINKGKENETITRTLNAVSASSPPTTSSR